MYSPSGSAEYPVNTTFHSCREHSEAHSAASTISTRFEKAKSGIDSLPVSRVAGLKKKTVKCYRAFVKSDWSACFAKFLAPPAIVQSMESECICSVVSKMPVFASTKPHLYIQFHSVSPNFAQHDWPAIYWHASAMLSHVNQLEGIS